MIELCDRSKVVSVWKIKGVFVYIFGVCYILSGKEGSIDFLIRLVFKGNIYSWNEGSKGDNL